MVFLSLSHLYPAGVSRASLCKIWSPTPSMNLPFASTLTSSPARGAPWSIRLLSLKVGIKSFCIVLLCLFCLFTLPFYPSCTAPTRPPSNIKVTLIEADTALVSWKLPDEPNVAVTRYTILYASRNAWIAGEWKVLQREGRKENGRMCTLVGVHWRGTLSIVITSCLISSSCDHRIDLCLWPVKRSNVTTSNAVFVILYMRSAAIFPALIELVCGYDPAWSHVILCTHKDLKQSITV